MRVLLFALASLIGAVAIWFSYAKSKQNDDEWDGLVLEKRESINRQNDDGQKNYLLVVEIDTDERIEVEVGAELYESVAVGNRIAKNAAEAAPHVVD